MITTLTAPPGPPGRCHLRDRSLTMSAMSEPDTTASGVGADAPTGIHEPVPAPDDVLAYSESIDLPELRSTRIPVVAFAVATVALAAAVTDWFLLRPAAAAAIPRPSAAAATTPAASPPASPPTPSTAGDVTQAIADTAGALQPPAPPPPTATGSPAGPANLDSVYLMELTRAHISYTDPNTAIEAGHNICRSFTIGDSETQIVGWILHNNPVFTRDSAISTIGAAVTAYCPQYLSRIGG